MLSPTEMKAKQQVSASPFEDGPKQATAVLISMPFGLLLTPSLALGLLKATLAPLNISTKVCYFTLPFARLIGIPSYQRVANEVSNMSLVGEWIFAESLFGPNQNNDENYIKTILCEYLERPSAFFAQFIKKSFTVENNIKDIMYIRGKAENFMDECLYEVLSYHPKIVGFTSVFQQHVSSLSLAKRIKAQAPETFIIFGGANCEGAMGAEMIRQFPFVDAVVSGEGDLVFPEIVQRILEGKSLSHLQGVYTRHNIELLSPGGHYPNTPSVRNMDALPFPDFDDFYGQYEASRFNTSSTPDTLFVPSLSFETSRGCWWGEKHHCTFCGLNGSTMMFRSKSAQRALDELIYLTSKYPGYPLSVVDNILDMKYFKSFIPMLTELRLDLNLFYEVKANLKKEQLQMLYDAGVRTIQPGIESFSDPVLELMRKGVKGLQNVQLLKWCKEIGIQALWSILWGFPGEAPAEYTRMTKLLPLLTHLPPPAGGFPIRLDRFSPNFDDAEQLGFMQVKPAPAYIYIYPFDQKKLAHLAYFFAYEYREVQDATHYVQDLTEEIKIWQRIHNRSTLIAVDEGTHLLIIDTRPIAHQRVTVLTELQRLLYKDCDHVRTLRQLQKYSEEVTKRQVSMQEIGELLRPLVEHGLMLRDDSSYLSLAIPQRNLDVRYMLAGALTDIPKEVNV